MTKRNYCKHLYQAFIPRIQCDEVLPKVQIFQQAKFYGSKHGNFLHHFQIFYLKIQIHYQKDLKEYYYIQSDKNLLRLLYVIKFLLYFFYLKLQLNALAFRIYFFYDAKFNNFFPFPIQFHLTSLILRKVNLHNFFLQILEKAIIDCLKITKK